jgi:GNAT superfamily N-acetyltransferase
MQNGVLVRPAIADEGERLRDIAVAAKAFWRYDTERVLAWASSGDFSSAGLARKQVFVAVSGRTPVGWAATIRQGKVLWLDDLWVEPGSMGRGIGRQLFEHAVASGKQQGAARVEWEAEPNAIGFYEKMGGRYVRDGDLSVWGRVNPVMGLDLS